MAFVKKFMIILSLIVVLLVTLVIGIGYLLSVPFYKDNQSKNFNGTVFKNVEDVSAKSFTDVIKWMINREQGEWSKIPPEDVTFGIIEDNRVKGSVQVITFVNHSTFLIQTDGLNILTDPIWSNRASPFNFAGPKRMRPPGIKFGDLPEIDMVLISHNHYDHLDLPTIKRLEEKYSPLFVVPLGVDRFLSNKGMENVIALDWWEEESINGNVGIASVPAQHFSGRGLFDRDKTLWCGYVIQSMHGNIYFAGDTGYGDFFKDIAKRYQPVKTALIPIGAYKPRWFMKPMHVNPAEAIKIHKELNSELTIGMHFNTFPLADDGQNEPVNDLSKALEGENVTVLEEGKSIRFSN